MIRPRISGATTVSLGKSFIINCRKTFIHFTCPLTPTPGSRLWTSTVEFLGYSTAMIIPVRCFSCGKVNSLQQNLEYLNWPTFRSLVIFGNPSSSCSPRAAKMGLFIRSVFCEASINFCTQRRNGSTGVEALLLSSHGHDTRWPHWETTQVRHYNSLRYLRPSLGLLDLIHRLTGQ